WDDESLLSIVAESVKRSKIMKKNTALLKEIEEQNRKIEAATQIIDRELKLKEKKLMESEKTISSVQKQLGSINDLLARISSGKTFRDLISATLDGLNSIVKCEVSSIVSVTEGSDVFNIYYSGKDHSSKLSLNNDFNSVLSTIKDRNYGPLILNSIYATKSNRELLLGNSAIYSMLLYPIYIKSGYGAPSTFIIVLGRTGKDSFEKSDVNKLKDISSSIYATLQRIETVDYIQSSLKQWENAFNSILDPLFIVSTNYEILRINEAVEKKIGAGSAACVGKKCYQLFKNLQEVCNDCLVNKVISSGNPSTSDGSICFENKSILATAYPVMDKNGINSVIQYNNDRSSEFKLYKQLVQAEKLAAIGMLAANIAHEINNPLGGILAYSQLLKSSFADNESIYSDLNEIESACQRSKNIISNLIDFSRDTSKDKKAVFSVKKLIHDTLPLMNICLKSHKLIVDLNGNEDLFISGNMGQLQQVLFNLITNSVHATPSGGEIKIRVENNNNGYMLIQISDTGCGINECDLARIFEPFFTTKEKGKGTGLGLFVSHGIIKDHGGEIKVVSKMNEGTVFSIDIPVWSENNDSLYNQTI
ncbi:MAG: ATP-binding protein, partial [bacterium]